MLSTEYFVGSNNKNHMKFSSVPCICPARLLFWKANKRNLPCKQLQKSIRDQTKFIHTITQENIHCSFVKQLGQLVDLKDIPRLTPFLNTYLEHLSARTTTTQQWPSPIIIFSLAMYCRAGTTGYEELRKYLPLPSLRTLRSISSKVSSGPGINDSAIAAFIEKEPASICISFDEIYYSQGLKL